MRVDSPCCDRIQGGRKQHHRLVQRAHAGVQRGHRCLECLDGPLTTVDFTAKHGALVEQPLQVWRDAGVNGDRVGHEGSASIDNTFVKQLPPLKK